MKRPGVRPQVRRLSMGLLAGFVASCLLLITATSVLANTVNISDQAGVLDQNRVRSEASNLSYPINIYTTNAFQGSASAFQQQSASHVTSPSLIVMAIDTVNHHFYTAWGKSVPLSTNDATSAANAFRNSFNNGDYTGATVAAVQSLEGALSSRGNSGSSPLGNNNPASSAGGLLSGGLGTLCCVGLLILIIGAVIFGVMRRRGGAGRRMAPGGMGMGMPYQQPYPPNYGQGGYNQGGGIGPLGAGGIGAAAGGLIGYELGKEQGENERGGNQGGNWGGDGGGNFGGGGGGDFGGGGGGGGGDFGGGGGGDFGGGGGGGGGGGSF